MACVSFKILERPEEFRLFAGQWNDHVARSLYPSIFLTYEYLISAYETQAQASRIHIVLIMDDQRLLGAAPLKIETRTVLGIRSDTLLPIGKDDAEGSFFLILDSEALFYNALVEYLALNRALWSKLLFPVLHETHPFPAALVSRFSSSRDLILTRSPAYTHPVVNIQREWSHYFGSLKPKFVRKLRAGLRKIAEYGEPKVLCFKSTDKIEEHFDLYTQLEDLSWKTRMNSGIRHTDNLYNLYLKTLERCSRNNWVELTFLAAGERLIAGGIGYVYGDRYEYMQTVYDSALSASNPGMILMTANVWRAFDSKLKIVDFRGNYVDYKRNWSNGEWKSMSTCVRKTLSGEGIAYFIRKYLVDPISLLRPSQHPKEKIKITDKQRQSLTITEKNADGAIILDHAALSTIILADSKSPGIELSAMVTTSNISREEIEHMIQERLKARLSRDWARADEIKRVLTAYGVKIYDTTNETRWELQQVVHETCAFNWHSATEVPPEVNC